MIIRDIVKGINDNTQIIIKPNGSRVYFDGSCKEIPRPLLDCSVNVTICSTTQIREPFAPPELLLLVWINHIYDYDLLIDADPDARFIPDFLINDILSDLSGYFRDIHINELHEMIDSKEISEEPKRDMLFGNSPVA